MDELEPEQSGALQALPPPVKPRTAGLELTAYHSPPEAFPNKRLVFHPDTERSSRSREPVFLLENGPNDDEEYKSNGSDGPPTPKRVRIDEDDLIAKAVLPVSMAFQIR
uniref:Uncharacterized protein n=1 Tax=Phytophthora infestans TaxID=4787 RepID=Q572K6_PHYIN|nr:hypothetical protein PI35.0180c [Phytophthora infestans]